MATTRGTSQVVIGDLDSVEGEAALRCRHLVRHVRDTTTDATVTTLMTVSLIERQMALLEARVIAYNVTDDNASGYIIRAVVKRAPAGAAVLVGVEDEAAGGFAEEEDALTATIDVNGNDARVRVTGLGGPDKTINWYCTMIINTQRDITVT